MTWWARFLASKFSGWTAVIATVIIMGGSWFGVDKIRQLQTDAAYCRGQLDAQEGVQRLREQVSKYVEQDAGEVRDEIGRIKQEAERALETPGEDSPDGLETPSGCAAERAPDAILQYHGWMHGRE